MGISDASACEELLRPVRLDRTRETGKCVDIGRSSEGQAALPSQAPDGVALALHRRLQARVHVVDRPVVALPILNPFEVRDGDTTRIRQNIR